MPLPQLTQPSGTPLFRARGHAVEQASQFAHPRFQTGHSRARRVWTASERRVTVSLLLKASKMAAWFAWYEGPLAAAGGRFAAQVANDETDEGPLLWWAAEFEGSPVYTPRGPGHWLVNAVLRLTGAGQAEGPYTGELGYRVLVQGVGSAMVSVQPTLGYQVVAALQQQILLGYSVTVALED